jgi:hypothetical protein
MKYLYLLLLILILYYLLKNIYSNYSNSEHFDPSLVPVSSIITLAKVAQKLVDGNGTLTNPGNLQIGISSAPGNLKVTGVTELLKNVSIYGTTNIHGNATVFGNFLVGGITNLKQINALDQTPRIHFHENGNNYYESGPGNKHYFQGLNGKTGTEVTIQGNLSTNGLSVIENLDVTGNVTMSKGLNVKSGGISIDQGNISINNGTVNLITDSAHELYLSQTGVKEGPGAKLITGDTTINGTLDVKNDITLSSNLNLNGNLCVGSTCLSERTLNLIFPPIMPVYPTVPFTTDGVLAWARGVVDNVYPILFWDGDKDKKEGGVAYLCRAGHLLTNCNSSARNNPKFSSIKVYSGYQWDGTFNNSVDSVIVYPGYGVECWSDDNTIGYPYVYNNDTKDIVFKDLTDLNVTKFNLKDHMSTFSTFKL